MEDFFDYIKIEANPNSNDYNLEELEGVEGIEYESVSNSPQKTRNMARANVDVSVPFSFSINFNKPVIDIDNAKMDFKGSFNDSITVNLKYYSTQKNKELTFSIKNSMQLTGSFNSSVNASFPIAKVITVTPVPGVYIDFTPKIVFEVSASVTVSIKASDKLSISCKNKKWSVNYEREDFKFDNLINSEITFFVGLDLSPKIVVLTPLLAEIGIGAKVGVEAKTEKAPLDKHHLCTYCIQGSISGVIEVSGKANFLGISTNLKTGIKYKADDIYYSFDKQTGDFTTCPYRQYEVTLKLKDENGNKLGNAKILNAQGTELKTTNKNGVAKFYLQDGKHLLKITKNNKEISRIIQIKGKNLLKEIAFDDNDEYIVGTCGENLIWELNRTKGILNVTGKGKMDDYWFQYQPWEEYHNEIKTVTFGEGVESVGNYAFYYCTGLNKINLSTTIKTIGTYAFGRCFGANFSYKDINNSVKIPSSVISIGDYAFVGCGGLEKIELSEGLKEIGDWAFELTELYCIKIPNTVEKIGSCFIGSTNITEITLPSSLTTIKSNTFANCSTIMEITIPASVTKIETDGLRKATNGEYTIYFEGNIPPEIDPNPFGAFDHPQRIMAYYPNSWKSIPEIEKNENCIIEWRSYVPFPKNNVSLNSNLDLIDIQKIEQNNNTISNVLFYRRTK